MGIESFVKAHLRGDLDKQGGSITWILTCTPDIDMPAVFEYAKQYVEQTWNGLALDNIRVKYVRDDTYVCEAIYGNSSSGSSDRYPESNGYILNFDTSGQTMHITTAIDTESYINASAGEGGEDSEPPEKIDVKKTIGWDGKKVAGVDIVVGVHNFSEDHTVAATKVTTAYRKKLSAITGCVNSDSFRGFAAGEVMFLGATGRRISSTHFSITYKFAVSPNSVNLEYGDIKVNEKKGWEYADVMYADDEAGDRIVRAPMQVNIHKVYEEADFSDLDLGSS